VGDQLIWATQKIASSTAKAEYVRAKKHIRNYLENVDYHAQCEADRAIAERKKAAEAALLPLQKQAKRIELVDTLFLPQFSAPMFRCKFLVLTGPSCVGKTIFACSLAGASKTLVVDCGSAEQSDLRHFNPLMHECVVFDECPAMTVSKHRKIFQGTTQEVSLGHSATNMFTYKVWLHGIKMVITTNRWYEDMAALDESDQAWLEHNSIVVTCTEPLYED